MNERRGLYPPQFWELGDRSRLEAAIELFDGGEVAGTVEEGGRIRGRTRSREFFEIDPGRPARHFRCSCGVRSDRGNRFPCQHATAGFLAWWRKPDRRAEGPKPRPTKPPLEIEPVSGDPLRPLGPMDEIAARIAVFALAGEGLSQARLSAEAGDPLALSVELLAPDGATIARISPSRRIGFALLRDLPRMLGESVRWVGKLPPARVSDRPAEWVVQIEAPDPARMRVERMLRLPARSGKRRRLVPASVAGKPPGEVAVVEGIVYPIKNALPATLLGRPSENLDAADLKGAEIERFLAADAPALRSKQILEGEPELVDARIAAPVRLESLRVDTEGDALILAPTFRSGPVELGATDLAAGFGKGFLRKGESWIRLDGDPLGALGWRPENVQSDGRVKLSRAEWLRTRALLEGGTAVERTSAVDELEQALLHFAPPHEHELPAAYRGTLRPYQKQAFDWLLFLRSNHLPAILADEMGLGKTHELLAYLATVRAEVPARPNLVVCPRTVLDHWLDRVRDFAPELSPHVHFGPDRADLGAKIAKHGLVLTTYGLLARDADLLSGIEWESVVLDEAQRIKNASTKTARAARRLLAQHRVAATGTPLENHLDELRSIFEFLLPGFFGSEDDFADRFVKPIRAGEAAPMARLRAMVDPFKLRRLKRDVLQDLPPKLEDVVPCQLSADQQPLYKETLERKARPLLADLSDSGKPIDYLHVFAVLSRLKRICDHPYLVLQTPEAKALRSGKFETFLEILHEALDGEEKVVVFSQYLEMLDLIGEHLKHQNIGYVELRGSTRDRAEVVRRFQTEPRCQVFLGSLLAGGVGIDLTAASVVIHYDRWWNAAREDQATDRVHRIGQTLPVQVVSMVTRNTLEEAIDQMIRAKRSLFEGVVTPDETTFKSFDREDLMALLRG